MELPDWQLEAFEVLVSLPLTRVSLGPCLMEITLHSAVFAFFFGEPRHAGRLDLTE